ncbi:hypothetical protein D3C72_2015050 [compost metagenome]
MVGVWLFIIVMGFNRMDDICLLSTSCDKVSTNHGVTTFLNVVHRFTDIVKHTYTAGFLNIEFQFGR